MSQTFIVVIALIPAAISSFIAFLAVRALRELRKTIDVTYRYGDWWYGHSPYALDVQELIEENQERFGIRLTAAARQMLLIPVAEAYERGDRVPSPALYDSIGIIFSTLREESALPGEQGRVRSATSVIRAFWKNFCNIPPFCSGKERG